MASLIPGFIKRPVKDIRNYFFGRIQHELEEGLLAAQTALRIAKERVEPVQEYVRNSVPVRVFSEYDKVVFSYKVLREKEAAARQESKAEAKPPTCPPCRVTKRIHVQDYALWLSNTETARPRSNQNPHRAAARRIRRRAIDRSEVQGLSRKVSINLSTHPVSEPSIDYMENLRSLYPASDSYEERKKRTDTMIMSVFGPERVNLPVGYASGHSGISDDPVLTEYNHNKHVEETLGHHREYQAMLRRQEEEQQRKKAEQEAERAKKIAVFEHYWGIYEERVCTMVHAGEQFHAEIGQVLRAYENDNVQAMYEAAHTLNNNTLEPVMALFEEMRGQIVLESMGATELRNAWPTDSIDRVLAILTPDVISSLPNEAQNAVGYMLQSLHEVCQPIFNAVELTNPLNEPEPHVFEAKPIPAPKFEHYLSERTKQAPKGVKVEVPEGENAGKNYNSLSALTAENNAAKEATRRQRY